MGVSVRVRVVRWGVALVLLAGAGGGALFFRQRQQARLREEAVGQLRTAELVRGDLQALVSTSGSLQPAREALLFFGQAGIVEEVLVEAGERVEAGQLLARLDDTDASLALRRAEDALAIQELALEKAQSGPDQGELEVARANLLAAQTDLNDLLAGGGPQEAAIARLDYDDALAAYDQAFQSLYQLENAKLPNGDPISVPEEALKLARIAVQTAYATSEIARLTWEQASAGASAAAVAVAQARIAQAQAILAQLEAGPSEFDIRRGQALVEQAQIAVELAQQALERTRLNAPFGGLVVEVNLQSGAPALGDAPAIRLLDSSRFHLEVAVDEVDVARIVEGQALVISVDALPEIRLNGAVERIGPAASTIGGVVTYPVRLSLEPGDALLLSGMSATAEIVVAEVPAALLAPNWALRRDRATGDILLSLQEGDQIVERKVTVGLRGEQFTEILSGAEEDDIAAVRLEREQIDLFGGGG